MKIDEVIDLHTAYANENSQLIHFSTQGLKWIRRQPAAMNAVDEWERLRGSFVEETARVRRERAAHASEAVAAEVDAGFPLLYSHATVGYWSTLESCVEGVIVAWLLENRAALQSVAISRLKIELGEYENLDSEGRMRYVLDEIKRSTKADLKVGVGRFESILEKLEVSSGVSAELKKQLMGLSQIRNILVHKAGIADRRFAESCPWFGFKVGQRIQVTAAMFEAFESAVPEYIATIVRRLKERSAAIATTTQNGVCS